MKFFLFLSILIVLSLNTIQAKDITGSFILENTPPIIDSIELNNNELEIYITDVNGYKDIKKVTISFNDEIVYATNKSSSNEEIVYSYEFDQVPTKAIIEVSDSKNTVTKEFNLFRAPKRNFFENLVFSFKNFFTNLFR